MKRVFFLICAVMVLSVSAFAADSHFADSLHIEYGTAGVLDCSVTSGEGSFCLVSTSTNTAYEIWFVSLQNNATASISGTKQNGDPLSQNLTSSVVLYNGDNVVYYYNYSLQPRPTNTVFSPDLTIYPYQVQHSVVANDYQSMIDNPDVGVQSSFALPCGNVAYFKVSSAQTVDFKSTYQILSKFFANSTYGYWSDSGQRFGPVASLPTSSTSFPIASQDPLYWSPDPQSKNLLGLSKTGLASASCIIGQWYAFYNPAYNSNNTDWTTMDITGATVLISGYFSEIKIFPLEQVVDYQNGSFVGGSNDDYQSYFDGNISSDGSVSFTDQDGVSSVPTAGGQNLLAPNETAQSLVEKVVGILQNLLSEIQSLFTFGYDAIQSLVGIMSSFVSSFSQLYTWLPTEVYSALISAVIVAVVVGIFKVFL